MNLNEVWGDILRTPFGRLIEGRDLASILKEKLCDSLRQEMRSRIKLDQIQIPIKMDPKGCSLVEAMERCLVDKDPEVRLSGKSMCYFWGGIENYSLEKVANNLLRIIKYGDAEIVDMESSGFSKFELDKTCIEKTCSCNDVMSNLCEFVTSDFYCSRRKKVIELA
jgi:hypothetical protein